MGPLFDGKCTGLCRVFMNSAYRTSIKGQRIYRWDRRNKWIRRYR